TASLKPPTRSRFVPRLTNWIRTPRLRPVVPDGVPTRAPFVRGGVDQPVDRLDVRRSTTVERQPYTVPQRTVRAVRPRRRVDRQEQRRTGPGAKIKEPFGQIPTRTR